MLLAQDRILLLCELALPHAKGLSLERNARAVLALVELLHHHFWIILIVVSWWLLKRAWALLKHYLVVTLALLKAHLT